MDDCKRIRCFHYKMLYMEPEIPNFTQPSTLEVVPADPTAAPITGTKFEPVASYVHTSIFAVVLMCVAIISAKLFAIGKLDHTTDTSFHISKYLPTLILQWTMFGITYFGMKQKKIKLGEIIGGWWKSIEDFLLDIVVAFGFFVVAIIFLAVFQFML